VVIGEGITGLACAFRLQQLGIRALILLRKSFATLESEI
jgi:glycine/D-amino acid oxidase-like deaminating enzyme